MNIVNIEALITQGRIVKTADIDPANDYAIIGKYQTGNSKRSSANADTYKAYVIPLSELLGGGTTYTGSNGITLVGNDFRFTSQNISQFTNDSGYLTGAAAALLYQPIGTYLTALTGWVPDGNTFGSEKFLGTVDNFDIPFRTNNVEVARLTTAGSLGIGAVTPLAKLHVAGTSILGTILDNIGGWFHVVSVGAGNGMLFVESGGSTNDVTAFRLSVSGGASGGSLAIYNNAGSSKVVLSGNVGASRAYLTTDAGAPAFEVTNVGDSILSNMVAMPGLQTGNAGLVAGDLYKDTAANILAAGDLVVGIKV